MAWIILVFAGVLEVVWAFYMKQSAGFTRLVPSAITIVTMVGSFALLAVSMRTLPLGSAYAIWSGIGAVGAFFVGIWVLGEQASVMRMVAVALILAGLVLLRVAGTE